MLKKTITYRDLEGEEITEDFYFHFSPGEIVKLQAGSHGGLSARIQRIIDSKDNKKILREFEELILSSYGRRSDDGKSFVKTQEYADYFKGTDAYDQLILEFFTDGSAAAAFVNALVTPEDMDRLATLVATNTELPKPDPNDEGQPAWYRENRLPTPKELQSMSKTEQALAMRVKMARNSAEKESPK